MFLLEDHLYYIAGKEITIVHMYLLTEMQGTFAICVACSIYPRGCPCLEDSKPPQNGSYNVIFLQSFDQMYNHIPCTYM